MSDRYAVIGNPIAHSKSPLIHADFARETGQDLVYGRMLGDLERFEEEVRGFWAEGGRGLNVTLPFKERAWRLVDGCSPRAEAARAVNTLTALPDGRIQGDNTDGAGLVRDLCSNQGFDLCGKRILLLGAGGASRGLLLPLLEAAPRQLLIANRTPERAMELAMRFADLGEVTGCGFDALAGWQFDLILNATAAGLSGAVPPLPDGCLAQGGWTYDLLYSDQPTAFCRWGQAQGAVRTLDGLGMLVEQAAEAFQIWRGVRPSTAPVIARLRRY